MLPAATQDARKPAVFRLALIQRRAREGLWVSIFPALAIAVAVGLFVPRFWITTPSLIDDWFAITYAPTAVHELVHGHYNASLVDYGGRYRPAYAVMAYLQWTVLGGAHSVFLPTLFGLFRLLFFMAAVAALTVFLVRDNVKRQWQIIFGSAVPAFVVAIPGVPYNFVRFGVAEPTAFALLVLGLFAMAGAIRRHALSRQAVMSRRAIALFLIGYSLYLFGVYMWEPSVAVVLVLPALYLWLFGDPELRGTGRLPKRRTVAAISFFLVVPIAHVGYEVAGGTHEGKKLVIAALLCVPPASIALRFCLRRVRWDDRHAFLCLTLLAAGTFTAFASYRTAGSLSRYYIAVFVALAVTGAWLSTRLPNRARWVLLGVLATALVIGRSDREVRSWLKGDSLDRAAISLASDAYATGCPVYLVNFTAERSIGLARLLDVDGHSTSQGGCYAGQRAALAVFSPSRGVPLPTGWSCTDGWQPVRRLDSVTLLACDEFHPPTTIPSQDVRFRVRLPIVRLVKPSSFVPASTLKSIA